MKKIKTVLQAQWLPFENVNEVIIAVDHFLEVHDADFYKEGICLLHDQLTKCENVGGDCLFLNFFYFILFYC